jgi:hypothetical protein
MSSARGSGPTGMKLSVPQLLHGARRRHPQAAGEGGDAEAIGKEAGKRVEVRLVERVD